jgi:hypothetical protein
MGPGAVKIFTVVTYDVALYDSALQTSLIFEGNNPHPLNLQLQKCLWCTPLDPQG